MPFNPTPPKFNKYNFQPEYTKSNYSKTLQKKQSGKYQIGEGGGALTSGKKGMKRANPLFHFLQLLVRGDAPVYVTVDWLKQKSLKSHRTEWHHSTRKWGGKFQKIWGELQLCIINTDQILTWPLNHVCQRLKVRPQEPNWDLWAATYCVTSAKQTAYCL